MSKAESSRLLGRRKGHVRRRKGEKDHDESVTADFRALNISLSSGSNQMIKFQTRSLVKMLEQQERQTQIMEKILETQTKFLSESSQPRFQSRSPGRPEGFRPRTFAMQCYNCREFGHLSSQCPQKGTIQPGISANLDTNRQPIVKSFLQRVNSEQVNSINKVQAEAVLGPTVYVMVDLDGRKHKALVGTGSKVNILSEKTYSQYEQRSKIRPFREQVLSATNDLFEILGVFTGEITFDAGVKVKAGLLVTPNKDVPSILGTQVMEENKVSIVFHSKQLMMEKESNVVNLQFAYKSEVPRHVHLCETEAESGPDQIETTEKIKHGVTAETNLTLSCDEELEQICSLAIPDINQQTDDRKTLLREFRDVFAMNENELGQTHLVQYEIGTGETLPIKLTSHRLAPGKIIVVKKEIEDMVARNIIRPSNSPCSAPIVLVTKKDGSNRMCTDFRRLNEVTKKNAFPLPRIDQILDYLHGATIFSSIDLASRFWQVPLAESAITKTAFVTPDGEHYEYLRLPFGLCNAPRTFQQLMTSIFNEYLFSFVLIFLDDVLVFSRNVEEHEKHMSLVFNALRQANL